MVNQQIFFVAQGGKGNPEVYNVERFGQFLWAPKTNENGRTFHHWTNIMHVKKGDLILHYASGEFRAVSQAVTNCFDSEMPKALPGYWENVGRMVRCCPYVEFYPMARDIFRSIINEYKYKVPDGYYERYGRYNNEFHSAFTRNNTVNQGYLFHLQKEIFDAVIKQACRNQSELTSVDFIAQYLIR